jgi:hypothetical protein
MNRISVAQASGIKRCPHSPVVDHLASPVVRRRAIIPNRDCSTTKQTVRKPRHETNLYSFKGLIAAATPQAIEVLEVRAQAAEAKKKRLESKKPKLVVNNPKKGRSRADAPFSVRAGRRQTSLSIETGGSQP